jgi:hypothetical protein
MKPSKDRHRLRMCYEAGRLGHGVHRQSTASGLPAPPSSWLNLVECFFAAITGNRIRHDAGAKHDVWTRTANEMLAS